MLAQVVAGAVRAQIHITRQNVEDLRPILTMPLVTLVSLAVLLQSGRADLAPYGLVAAVLMTTGQMGNFVASEIVFQERNEQTLELVVASPAPYYYVLLARVLVLTSLGLVGAAESWLIARLVFGLHITVHHPALAMTTLLFTSVAAAGTALLTTSLFALGTQVRTFQNAINGPLYLLGGVLVPTVYLPTWLQPLSPFVFFYWAAELLRAALSPAQPKAVATGLVCILALGAGTALVARLVLRRMLDRLRRDGTLGLNVNALRVYRQGLLVGVRDFRDFWTLRSWLFGWMLRILTNAFAWVLLGRVVGSETRVHYLLLGNALAAGSASALWASNATTWSRYDGSHPLLVVAPSGLLPAVIGRTSIWLFNGAATSLASFAVLLGAFGYRPSLTAAVCLPFVIVLVCTSTYCFALFMGALLNNRARWRNMALDIAGMLMMAICGVSVPLTFWPVPVQWIAQFLPLTHGLLAMRLLFEAGDPVEIVRQLGLELSIGAVWLTVALLTVTRLFNGGRADGSIELT